MTIPAAIILGIIQGASEFLPISSSGHLVIVQALLNVNTENIYLEVALHLGTLLAVLIYFRRDIFRQLQGAIAYLSKKQESKVEYEFCLSVLVGTIPAGVGGMLLKEQFESAFASTLITGIMLLVTATFLLITRFVRIGDKNINHGRALVIGVAQLAAIMPGISRSGSTIATAIFLGMNPLQAARFSFILSIPAVFGAFILKLIDALKAPPFQTEISAYLIGASIAFLVGLIAIHYLLKLIAKARFYLFAFWCLVAGLFAIFYL